MMRLSYLLARRTPPARRMAGAVVATLAATMAAASTPVHAQRTPVAIRGGTVITMAGARIPGGTVLLRDGKIVAVGAQVAIPNGATIVDATGKYVMPGIVDAMTYYGVDAADLAELSSPITPQVRILNAYHPSGASFTGSAGPLRASELLAGGVTTQYVGPGDATIVGGQGAVVKTAAADLGGLTVRDPAAMNINIGVGPTKTFRERKQTPNTHSAVMSLLRQALVRAQEYEAAGKAYAARPAAERAKTTPPRNDAGTDALVALLHREMPARIQANTAQDIRGAIGLAEEFGLELVIHGGAQAYQLRDVLAAKKIPVVLGPVSHPYVSGEEIPDVREYPAPDERNAAWLTAAGVPVAIGSYSRGLGAIASGVTGKWLLLESALATSYGLSEDDALRAITSTPARILGVAGRVGSLEVGKDADVLILDGPPLSVKTWVERTYVDGELVHTRTPQR
jgi:imidazolonepropionase-like amidohydrolase